MKDLFPNSIGNYKEALILADKLRAYWARKGSLVRVWIETSKLADGTDSAHPIYSLRSNMINGLPRSKVE